MFARASLVTGAQEMCGGVDSPPMQPPSISSGAYLAQRLGFGLTSSALSGNGGVEATSSNVTPALQTDSIELSVGKSGYVLLRDSIDRWSSSVALIQIADDDLDTLAGYLLEVKDVLSQIDADTTVDTGALYARLDQIEEDMSGFLGARTVMTPQAQLVYNEFGDFQTRYFEALQLGAVNERLGDASLAVVEVDMGMVLSAAHDRSTCPLCARTATTDALSVETLNAMSQDLSLTSNGGEGDSSETVSGDTNFYSAPTAPAVSITGSLASTNSGVSYIETLRMSTAWDISAGETLSYSYYTGSVPYAGYPAGGVNPPTGVTSLLPTHESNFDLAFTLWDHAVRFSFEKVTESAGAVGEIRNAYTDSANTPAGSAAYAFGPGNSPVNGDIWYGSHISSNLDFSVGGYGFMTALHEIGHAIGLSHPFDGGSATGATLAAAQDYTRNTVMSYTNQDRNYYLYDSGSGVGMRAFYAATPMLYDVATVEYLYGASATTNTGDTTYAWADSPKIIETIVDSGGSGDTIDASNQTLASQISLVAGTFSSIGIMTQAEQIAYWTAAKPGISAAALQNFIAAYDAGISAPSGKALYTGEDNVAIAYSAVIENAIGGQGNDTLTGNSIDNQLRGNQGDDTLDGAAGTDTAVFRGAKADYTITVVSATSVTVRDNASTDGTDTLWNIELLRFSDQIFDPFANTSSAATGAPIGATVASSTRGSGSPGTVSGVPSASGSAGGGGGGGGFAAGHLRGGTRLLRISTIDAALDRVTEQRTMLGAMINSLQRQVEVLQTSRIHTAESQSRVVDADYAEQTMILARQQILQAAGQQMIALINTNGKQVLSLLS
jgi:flagellin-like hook-associated protein FlgL